MGIDMPDVGDPAGDIPLIAAGAVFLGRTVIMPCLR